MRVSDETIGKLLILPSVGCLALYCSFLIFLAYISTTGWYAMGSPTFAGVKNFETIFTADPTFNESLSHSLLWTAATVVLQLAFGLGSALVLNESMKGSTFWRASILMAYMVPSVVAGLTWRWILDDTFGVVSIFLKEFFGISGVGWFYKESAAMWSLIMVGVWRFFPFATLTLLSRLQTIPKDYYEAAQVDGASVFQRFRNVTLPLLKEAIIVVVLLRAIFMFTKFDIIWVITRGGPGTMTTTLPVYIYRKGFWEWNFGGSAALSMVMFAIVASLTSLAIYFSKMYK